MENEEDAESCFALAQKLRDPSTIGECLKWYLKAAEQGHSAAQHGLGFILWSGCFGYPADEVEGAKWIRKSAEQGYVQAQSALGRCYRDGKGVEQDYSKAAEWFRKAAAQGDEAAQYELDKLPTMPAPQEVNEPNEAKPRKIWKFIVIIILIGGIIGIGVGVYFNLDLIRSKIASFHKEEEAPAVTLRVKTNTVIRLKPAANATAVKLVKKGEILTLTGNAEKGWFPVQSDYTKGYVNILHVEINKGGK